MSVARPRAGDALRRALLRSRLRAARSEAHVAGLFPAVGRVLAVSRVYVFQNFSDPVSGELCVRLRYEWTDGSVESLIDVPLFDHIAYREAGLEQLVEPLSENRPVELHRADAGAAGELFDQQEIRSMLNLPIVCRGRWWGLVGADECRRERQWQPAERGLLQSVAAAYGRRARPD